VSTYAEEVVLLSVDIAVIRALKDGALSSRGGGTIGGRGIENTNNQSSYPYTPYNSYFVRPLTPEYTHT